jgi:hypothetical protein
MKWTATQVGRNEKAGQRAISAHHSDFFIAFGTVNSFHSAQLYADRDHVNTWQFRAMVTRAITIPPFRRLIHSKNRKSMMAGLAAEKTKLPGFGLPISYMPEGDVAFPTALDGDRRQYVSPDHRFIDLTDAL